jgi:hypothetical protein
MSNLGNNMTELSGIVRRPDFAGGGVTEEERERLVAHSALWIERAFRTEPADPRLIETAIKGIYRAADRVAPRVIVVPSPFVMAVAGGIASQWWYLFENNLLVDKSERNAATRVVAGDATYEAVYEAICQATRPVTEDATDDARKSVTYFATKAATYEATYKATKAATDEAAGDAIYEATYNATYEATYDATYEATRAAAGASVTNWLDFAAEFVGRERAQTALKAADGWAVAPQGGNMLASGECFLTAARDILGLRLAPHAGYAYWEQAAINGGFRWVHLKFCLVSDFPEILRVNSRNQPHAEFGPSHRWRDGWSIWHLNGVKVDQWMAESHPDDMDARRVLQIKNVDQRRECIRRMGMERIIGQLDPKVLDTERREVGGEYRLLAVDMNHGEPWRFLQMVNQSTGAVHVEAVPRECGTVRQALNWRRAQNIDRDWFPIQLT